jgi:site-specific DNA recombinase
MKEPLRAVGYGRVSTEEQEKGTSLRDQFAGNHQKAKAIGAAVVAYFEDKDSGGFYLTRKGLQDALRTLEEGKANALIVKDLVRLTRNDRAEQSAIFKRVKDAGARIVYWDIEYENSPMGEFSQNVTGDFAILEKAVIRERTMRGRRRRAAEGQMPNRAQAPFGYILPKKNDIIRGTYPAESLGKYLIDEERAPFAVEIFNRYARGESLHGISRWLQSSGVKTVGGGRFWYPTVLIGILENPAYYGLAAFGRERMVTDESRALRGLKRRNYPVKVPESEWTRIPCPALVSRELWETCQKNRANNRDQLSTRPQYRMMLTGILRCPKCNRTMAGRLRERPYCSHYRCKESNPASNSAHTQCWKKCLNAAWLEPLILDGVRFVLQRPEALEAAYQTYFARMNSDCSEREYERLKQELSDLNREEMATIKAQIAGIQAGASAAIYEDLLRDLALKRTTVQTRVDEHTRARESIEPLSDRTALINKAVADVTFVLDAPDDLLTGREKNNLLRTIIEYIYLTESGEQFTIVFRGFDSDTQLVARVERNKTPSLRVIGAGGSAD